LINNYGGVKIEKYFIILYLYSKFILPLEFGPPAGGWDLEL
jgi:hypothetical protein